MGPGDLGKPKEGHLNFGGMFNSAFLEKGMLPKLARFGSKDWVQVLWRRQNLFQAAQSSS